MFGNFGSSDSPADQLGYALRLLIQNCNSILMKKIQPTNIIGKHSTTGGTPTTNPLSCCLRPSEPQ